MLSYVPHPFVIFSRCPSKYLKFFIFAFFFTFIDFYTEIAASTNEIDLHGILFWLDISGYPDMDLDDDIESPERKRKEGESISLPPFGLATYKMQGNVWVSGNCGRDQERLVSLLSVADSWLKQLRVQHHDFNYFTGIRRG